MGKCPNLLFFFFWRKINSLYFWDFLNTPSSLILLSLGLFQRERIILENSPGSSKASHLCVQTRGKIQTQTLLPLWYAEEPEDLGNICECLPTPVFKMCHSVFKHRLSIHIVQNPESTKNYAEKVPSTLSLVPLPPQLWHLGVFWNCYVHIQANAVPM